MIEILIKSDSRYPINRKKLREAVLGEFEQMKMRKKVEMSIFVVGARKMQELNKDYRKINKATNVLSFPLEDSIKEELHPSPLLQGEGSPLFSKEGAVESNSIQGVRGGKVEAGFHYPDDGKLYLGDVVLCYPVIVKQSAEYQMFVDAWMAELAVHGLQHLLGKHHE